MDIKLLFRYILALGLMMAMTLSAYAVVPTPIHKWIFNTDFNDSGSDPITITAVTRGTIQSAKCPHNGNNSCAAFSDGTIQLSKYFVDVSTDFTLSCFVNFNVSTDMGMFYESLAGLNGVRWYHQSGTNLECVNNPGISSTCSGAANPLNAWVLVTWVYNSTNAADRYQVYYNTTLQTDTDNTALTNSSYTNNWLGDGLSPWEINGYVDDCYVWNTKLTGTQVSEHYTNLMSASPALTLTGDLVQGGNYTLNNNTNYFLTNFTGTATYTSQIVNCSVVYNQVDSSDSYIVNITQANQIPKNFVGVESPTDVNLTCYNSNASVTLARRVYVDAVLPTITLYSVGYTANNSVLTRNKDTIYYPVRFQDTNLYAYNLTLFRLNSDGSRNLTLVNRFNETSLGTTAYEDWDINPGMNNSYYLNGKYKLFAQVWDSHTAKAIKAYDVKSIKDGKSYDNIKITSPDLATFTETKKTDRYSFDMTFKKENPSVIVECEGIQYINSGYKGHFVCFKDKKWVDFEDGSDSKVSPIRLDANRYQVGIIAPGKTAFSFNSIGDLNYVEAAYYFNITDGVLIRAIDHLTSQPLNNYTITLFNSSGVFLTETATNFNLTINKTGLFSVNITAPGYANNETTMTFTSNSSVVYHLYASNSLYLLIYDEQTNQLITQNVSLEIINYDNSSINTSTSSGIVFQAGFSPGQYELKYSSPGYNQRSYFTTITSSSTQQIDLFLLQTAEATYTNFIIEDETGNLIEGARLKAYRHFTDCNCFKIIEMDYANFNGVATLSLEHYDAKYRFIVDFQNSTLYSSTAMEGYRITETTYTLKALTYGDTYQSFYGTANLYTNLSYSNITKLFYYTINDPTNLVNQFCLYVTQMSPLSINGTEPVCTNCLSASSGTLTCNASAYLSNNRELIAKGWIHTNTTYSSYWTDIIGVILDKQVIDSVGKFGVFLGLIVMLTFTFGAAAILGVYGGIVGLLLGFIVVVGTGLIVMSLPVILAVVGMGVIVVIFIGGQK